MIKSINSPELLTNRTTNISMKTLFSNTMKCYKRFFFIPFIDGLSETQNGEKTSTYENIIRSIDEFGLIGELLTGAFGALVTVAIAGFGVLVLFLEVFNGIFS